MAKTEVINDKGRFLVQVTHREPFEDFFEIAIHEARFESRLDAQRLADRVQAAMVEAYPFTLKPLDEARWNFVSSASNVRFKAPAPAEVFVPTSAWAKRRIDQIDGIIA